MYALNLSEDKRVLSATYPEYATPEMPQVDKLIWENYPPDTAEGKPNNYFWINEYVYDPLPETEEPEPERTMEERVDTLEDEMAATKILLGVD